jgi:hypothetical protein
MLWYKILIDHLSTFARDARVGLGKLNGFGFAFLGIDVRCFMKGSNVDVRLSVHRDLSFQPSRL